MPAELLPARAGAMLALPMVVSRSLCSFFVVASLVLAGCAGKGAQRSMSLESMSPAPTKTTEADGYEGQLDDYESQLRAAGVQVGDKSELGAYSQDTAADPEGAGATPAADEDRRCHNICGLKDAICDLKDQVCDLATRHPDDPRYGKVCGRATEDCEVATEACEGCDA